jgi:hypothetical protein
VRNARNIFASATLQQVRFEHRWVLCVARSNFEAFVGVARRRRGVRRALRRDHLGPAARACPSACSYYLSPFVSLGFVGRLEALRFLVPFDTGDGVRRSDGGSPRCSSAATAPRPFAAPELTSRPRRGSA